MNTDLESGRTLAQALSDGLASDFAHEVVLFPPSPFLLAIQEIANGNSNIQVGSQDVYFEASGAYTGQISTSMVVSTGAQWNLVGHSERRHVFGETDEDTNKKVKVSLEAGLTPVLCVGEKLEEREAGQTEEVCLRQLRSGLEGLSSEEIAKTVVAYEPVWAIGTGKTATPEQADEVHRAIRADLVNLASQEIAAAYPILYGGSVNEGNVKELLAKADIDGALVGGASLVPDKFLAICNWDR